MTNTIYLCYKKEYRYKNIISSHRTSDGFKYTVQDEEEIIGPYVSHFSFLPTYQDAFLINQIIIKSRGVSITFFDDDWWAENFNSKKEPDRTECIGDLDICEELNTLLSDKYDITFCPDRLGDKCTVDFEKEIAPIVNCFDNSLNNAQNCYNKELLDFDARIDKYTELIKSIEKEKEIFVKNKNEYFIKESHSIFRNLVLNNSICQNEKVSVLFDEYPLDIALICCDYDLYLYLLEQGAYRSNTPINLDYALKVANIAAIKTILSLCGDLDYDSTDSFIPVKCVDDIKIKSIFDFFEKLPSNFADSFFVPEPEPIAFDGIELSTHNLKILQLIIYRRFSYDWEARKRDDIYYFDNDFHNLFEEGISREFDDIEPTTSNCRTFKRLCQFYKRDSEYEVGSNIDNSDRYECEINFECKLKCCIKFKYFKYVKWYYSKYAIKRFLYKIIGWNIDIKFREKYLNRNYLGDTFYNFLIEIYEDESININ